MAKINDIQNIIKAAAAKTNCYAENGNTALQAQQSVNEPVIPLPNTQPAGTGTSPASMISSRKQATLRYIKEHFKEGRHYMHIKGVTRPILTKVGAYALLNFLQLRENIEILNVTILPEVNFISYTVRCRLIDQNGEIVAEALGAANTQEIKFQKSGLGAQHLVATQSAKRSLCNALRNCIC